MAQGAQLRRSRLKKKIQPVETFRAIVNDRHVRVVPNRGHSSVAFFNRNVDRLKEKYSGRQGNPTFYILETLYLSGESNGQSLQKEIH